MYAHRQIYDTTQDVIPVPEQMRHHRIEVIFMVLDEKPVTQHVEEGLGTRIANLFSDVIAATEQDELRIPEREHGSPVTFE